MELGRDFHSTNLAQRQAYTGCFLITKYVYMSTIVMCIVR